MAARARNHSLAARRCSRLSLPSAPVLQSMIRATRKEAPARAAGEAHCITHAQRRTPPHATKGISVMPSFPSAHGKTRAQQYGKGRSKDWKGRRQVLASSARLVSSIHRAPIARAQAALHRLLLLSPLKDQCGRNHMSTLSPRGE